MMSAETRTFVSSTIRTRSLHSLVNQAGKLVRIGVGITLLDVVHNQLQQISAELIRDIKSRNIKLADLLVPLSMALISDYDDVYLGIAEEKVEEGIPKRHRKRKR